MFAGKDEPSRHRYYYSTSASSVNPPHGSVGSLALRRRTRNDATGVCLAGVRVKSNDNVAERALAAK